VHQRTDWDLTDPLGPARKYAYWDNRTSEVGLDFDAEQILADSQNGIDFSAFWFENEIDDILATLEKTTITDAVESNERALGDKQKQIKPVLYADEVADFERAIKATGNRNRGAALMEICRFYLEGNAKGQYDFTT